MQCKHVNILGRKQLLLDSPFDVAVAARRKGEVTKQYRNLGVAPFVDTAHDDPDLNDIFCGVEMYARLTADLLHVVSALECWHS